MGQSSSSNNIPRRNDHDTQNQAPSPRPVLSSSPPPRSPPAPPPPQVHSFSHSSAPPPQTYYPNYYHESYAPIPTRYAGPYNPGGNYPYNWVLPPPVRGMAPPLPAPPPFVEQQSTRIVKNDVNLHKHSIQLVPDEQNPDQHLVSFVFDATVDGSITIYYFAKEGPNFAFEPAYPEEFKPITTPFKSGTAQTFTQPIGSGIDLGFFSLEELSKPSNEGIYPLVIYADATPQNNESGTIQGQITLAVIERNNEGRFIVKVAQQFLLKNGQRYELRDIFGMVNEDEETQIENIEDHDSGNDCVICLSEPKDTAVLPCRHMCLCSECAKALSLQSNKCPICRQPIEQLMKIKVHNTEK